MLAAGAAGAQERPAPLPVLPLDVAWSTHLGGGPSQAPAYAADTAYVALRDGMLASVDLADGTLRWCVFQPVDWPPAAAGDLVVVARDQHVAARAASDGVPVWRLDLGSRVSAPPVWRSGWLIAGLENGEVVALRAADGGELWRRPLGAVLRAPATIAGQRLYLPLDDGRIVALRLATGDTIWTQRLGGRPRGVLALDALFVGSTDNFFYRLAFDDGSIEWRWRAGGDVIGAPRVDTERVYFVALDNVVRALDRRSGVQRWRRPLPLRPTDGPALVESALLVAGISPDVQLFAPDSGESAGVYRAPAELAARPFLVPGLPTTGTRLVVLTADGGVLGLAAGTGPPLAALGLPPPPLLPQPARLALEDVLPVEAAPLPPPSPPPGAETPAEGETPEAETPAEGEPPAAETPAEGEPPAAETPAEGEPPAAETPAEGEPPAAETPAEGEPPAAETPAEGEPPAAETPAEGEPPAAETPAEGEPPAAETPAEGEPPAAETPAEGEPPAAIEPAGGETPAVPGAPDAAPEPPAGAEPSSAR